MTRLSSFTFRPRRQAFEIACFGFLLANIHLRGVWWHAWTCCFPQGRGYGPAVCDLIFDLPTKWCRFYKDDETCDTHPWALVSRAVRTAERIGPIVASMSSEMFTKSCVRCWPTVNAKRWLWRYVALRSTLRTTFGGQDKLADLRNDSSFKRWAGGTTGCKLNDSCWIALKPVSSAASRAKLLDCIIRRF